MSEIIVVGAGAFGLSTAFALARLGKRVTLLDRFAAGSQTSPRAAGLFKLIQPDATRRAIARRSIDLVLNFESLTGVPLKVERSGSLMLARTSQHAAMVADEVREAQKHGIEVEEISAADVKRLAPYVEEMEAVVRAWSIPGDVYIEEPAWMLEALLQACRNLGVEIREHTPVRGLVIQGSEVHGVYTDTGIFEAPIVVNTAGPWARQVAEPWGWIATAPVRHQLVITEPVPGVQSAPIVRFVDSAVYLRPARGGIMLGGFERDPLPLDVRHHAPHFSADDVPLDIAPIDRLRDTVQEDVPALRTPIAAHRGGLFTMTPDGRFLVGPVPGATGLWTATGCNGSGFSSSPGIGQALAEWIVYEEPEIDLSPLDPQRFAVMNDEVLTAAGVYQYEHYYDPAASVPVGEVK